MVAVVTRLPFTLKEIFLNRNWLFLSRNKFSTMFWTELCVKYDNWRSFKWKLSALPDDSITEAVISLSIVIVGVLSSRACCNLRWFSYGMGVWTLVSMALSNLPENNTKKSFGRTISINCELFICLLFMNFFPAYSFWHGICKSTVPYSYNTPMLLLHHWASDDWQRDALASGIIFPVIYSYIVG